MANQADKTDSLSASQRLLLALKEARLKLEAAERAKAEPIAIIGMGCRFPGGGNNPDAFWRLLHDGVDAITEVPADRWPVDAYYDPDPQAPGKTYTRFGGFLDPVDQFDPEFFGISPREAVSIDPQQRLVLEVGWEALEQAGQAPADLMDSLTGVFIGITTNDYALMALRTHEFDHIDAYFTTGNSMNAAAGRLSYTLGLRGPSMVIDTACSSSLAAVHVACQSLRQGDCRMALAGGVNLILSPSGMVSLAKTQILSPDGRCKTFDAAANGIGRGEGCGLVVLKRLSDAIADADNILAVIRGSGVNQDGASSGLTVPNGLAQQALIRQVLNQAKVTPDQISYVEMHGTGTALGDPIEVRALAAALCSGRSADHPLTIGSVKTNIGHLESAAGISGLIKVVLALQHEEIPPHLHFHQPSPHIDWRDLPVEVPTVGKPWPKGDDRRMAGVSSFGASGANAHVLLEEAPLPQPLAAAVQPPLHLLPLSAKTETALMHLAARYQAHLAANPTLPLGDVCFTAATGRSHFKHRLGVMAATTAEMARQLAAIAAPTETTTELPGPLQRHPPKIAFLFTGQGSQYVNMGRELYDTQPYFRQLLHQCDQILQPYLDQSIVKILYPDGETAVPGDLETGFDSEVAAPLHQTAYTQPALFALAYALAQLWRSWGIQPAVVMGHSIGEYVAACLAGVFSLEDGLKLAAVRGQLMQALPPNGAMVSVMASETDVAAMLEAYGEGVAIAAVNGPESTVISGQQAAIDAVTEQLQAAGVKTKRLQVSHAFHSALMEPMLAAFEQTARQVQYAPPQLKLVSNVTGELADEAIATPAYWCRHVRQPVRFSASMETLRQQGCQVFLEIGPKPILLGMGRQCLPPDWGDWLPSMRAGQSAWQTMLQSLATLYVRGAAIDWRRFSQAYPHRLATLPTYPFQRRRYWLDAARMDSANGFVGEKRRVEDQILGLLAKGDVEDEIANFAQILHSIERLSDAETRSLLEQLS